MASSDGNVSHFQCFGVLHRGSTFDEEGVLDIPGWVLLGLEQGVEIPEGTLNEVVGWHLSETIDTTKKENYIR